MVARAEPGPGLEFRVGDLRAWAAADAPQVDVLVSNATLQWVPGHLDLLGDLAARVAPGGWFAFQVPGNFDEPSHTIRRDLAAEAPYAAHTAGVAVPASHDPEVYLARLAALGLRVDAWETTYLHVLTGPDPVFTWVSGTGARPTLQALPDDLRPGFEREFRRRLRAAYPPGGTASCCGSDASSWWPSCPDQRPAGAAPGVWSGAAALSHALVGHVRGCGSLSRRRVSGRVSKVLRCRESPCFWDGRRVFFTPGGPGNSKTSLNIDD